MPLSSELRSWWFPSQLSTGRTLEVGNEAPSFPKLAVPGPDGKPTVIAFLRHCGCPFAEKTFLALRALVSQHPEIRFVAVSHSDAASTAHWLQSLPDPSDGSVVDMIVDDERNLYAAWGLGVASLWHVLNPWSMYSVYVLGKQENIWNRPTESGSRWQSAGSFAVDKGGVVRWSRPNASADDVPDYAEALSALQKA